MLEYVNYVKISGQLSKVKKTDSGSYFARISQVSVVDGKPIEHYFELYCSCQAKSIHDLLVQDAWVLIEGKLTIFKSRLYHKTVIDVKQVTKIPQPQIPTNNL
ncbi:hypothetical protein [[Mycoplasma] testudinis]|uniref:hypothetical protein n=1 Tax=[Mycoplasma] testudinis TaxID=33924 RepID=UPI00047F50CB|nr:hypothetical protein [[Mycoplasma] testudinis]